MLRIVTQIAVLVPTILAIIAMTMQDTCRWYFV